MYIVTINNNGIKTEIHGRTQKLASGNVIQGINAIDSFTFSMLPSNAGFNRLREKKTLVTVFNTNKNRHEFFGRVLLADPSMSESGLIKHSVVCESYFGFLCDSVQDYVEEQNWTVRGLLQHIIDKHNSQIEDYKKFTIGEVTVIDPNDNLYVGIQRKNTWETIKEKLLDKLGGEIRFRVVDDVIYIDYLEEIGSTKVTAIAGSHNMKAIEQEKDPSAYITRLIPLGSKLTREEIITDDEGNTTTQTIETEERVDISSVNGGIRYIIDEEAEAEFGIRYDFKEWDDVTDPAILKTKGQNWLVENNKVQVNYSITALDLSLIGLDVDDFEVYNRHPIENTLLGIDDTVRIIKKNIDVCREIDSTIEVGANFKTLSDLQFEQSEALKEAINTVGKIGSNYVTNETLQSESSLLSSMIEQSIDNVLLSVSETYSNKSALSELETALRAELVLLSNQITGKISETIKQIEEVDGDLQEKFNTITKYFTFDINGLIIGQVDNPKKIVIDNDIISILVNGVTVQEFKADGTALIPILRITQMLDLFGLQITSDETHINCDYLPVEV